MAYEEVICQVLPARLLDLARKRRVPPLFPQEHGDDVRKHWQASGDREGDDFGTGARRESVMRKALVVNADTRFGTA